MKYEIINNKNSIKVEYLLFSLFLVIFLIIALNSFSIYFKAFAILFILFGLYKYFVESHVVIFNKPDLIFIHYFVFRREKSIDLNDIIKIIMRKKRGKIDSDIMTTIDKDGKKCNFYFESNLDEWEELKKHFLTYNIELEVK